MKVAINIEANGINATKIWSIACKDIDTGDIHTFRRVNDDPSALRQFQDFASDISLCVGHNIINFDLPTLDRLCETRLSPTISSSNNENNLGVVDTLIVSRMADYSRSNGHSVEAYAEEFGDGRVDQVDYSKFSERLEEYNIRKVNLAHKIYLKYLKFIKNYPRALDIEHRFQLIANDIEKNGFYFNKTKAEALLAKVMDELSVLDQDILTSFPPRLRLVREVTPKETKFGTLSRTDFRWLKDGDLSDYNGGPFSRCVWQEFNPSSHKQLVEVLNAAGWRPEDKTQTHINTLREYSRLTRSRKASSRVDIEACSAKLKELEISGWKINEANLDTLPKSAPAPARSLAKRILLESRRRTLTEWLGLVGSDNRIHGKFQAIGTWTHRTATQKPNMQNIPNEFDLENRRKLLGKELRQLWSVPKNRLLVGVDAEGIQLRIFAHLIDDPEFTEALVKGKKSDKTDPHSLNQRILGSVCKSRSAAKRFIYALLLGAGLPKLAGILAATVQETERALDNLLGRYTGFALLKETIVPRDAKRGYFLGLDGRPVLIPGDEEGAKRHLAMSGYLQNGEAVCMKMATIRWYQVLQREYPDLYWMLVDLIHDEWQNEVPNDVTMAHKVAQIMCDALVWTGEQLGLKCPLAGSYYNDDHNEHTIGLNWYETH